jgi:hypothetical protein
MVVFSYSSPPGAPAAQAVVPVSARPPRTRAHHFTNVVIGISFAVRHGTLKKSIGQEQSRAVRCCPFHLR